MMMKILIVLSSIASLSYGQVDPGAGSFRCLPCGRSGCYLSNTNAKITVNGLGTMTCGKIQSLVDGNDLFPDECGAVQVKTLATSDPCNCKLTSGGDCPKPGFTNTQTCNLCGGNKLIGDPQRVIQEGILDGATCIDVFDDSKFGAFDSVCSKAQDLVQKYCKCITLGSSVKPCIPLESRYCDPSDKTDTCCAGSCKYLKAKGGYRCTERTGDQPPPNYAPPGGGVQWVPCFSGEMQVLTESKGMVLMKDLEIGDEVLTGAGKFEPVYSFGHKHDFAMAKYLQIHSNSGKPLEISKEHMVFINSNHAVPAGMLKRGDQMLLPNGDFSTIQKIEMVHRQGMYAPFTLSGSVVVNGVVASSFVGLQAESEYLRFGKSLSSPFTQQWLAHVFEAPHRLAYRAGLSRERLTREGVSVWVELPLGISTWLVQQNAVVMAVCILPALVIFGSLWCLDQYSLTSALALCLILLLTRSKTSKTQRKRWNC